MTESRIGVGMAEEISGGGNFSGKTRHDFGTLESGENFVERGGNRLREG